MAANNLGNICRDQAKLDDAIALYRRSMALSPGNPFPHSNLLFTLHFHSRYDAAAILPRMPRMEPPLRRAAGGANSSAREHARSRSPAAYRLRLAGLSQALSCRSARRRCSANTITSSSRSSVTPALKRPDAVTERMRGYADQWRNIAATLDDALAEQIRQDQIDILFDFTMHQHGNRLLVFAQKPAPVQVTFVAYPGTTGLEAIDYRISDPHLDPPDGSTDASYSERTIRLPESFWCYDPNGTLDEVPAVNELPAKRAGHVTFGCLNNFCKINDGVLDLWRRVLDEVANSRLMVLADPGSHRQWLVDRLGVDASQLSSHHTVREANSSGCFIASTSPLTRFPITLTQRRSKGCGWACRRCRFWARRSSGRTGASMLRNVGLEEWIATTPDQYVAIAAQFRADLAQFGALRSILRARMEQSPLMDAPRFARAMESIYRDVWWQWCAEGR